MRAMRLIQVEGAVLHDGPRYMGVATEEVHAVDVHVVVEQRGAAILAVPIPCIRNTMYSY